MVGDLGDLPENGPQFSLCEALFGVLGQLKVISRYKQTEVELIIIGYLLLPEHKIYMIHQKILHSVQILKCL